MGKVMGKFMEKLLGTLGDIQEKDKGIRENAC
jgi:hypothetical protein